MQKDPLTNLVSEIYDFAFCDCNSLESVNIPAGVTVIGESAFKNCSNLESIDIPVGVTSIELWAFYGCSSLKKIKIQDGVTEIGYEAFRNCSSMESISLPSGITTVENGAFGNCSSLESIDIPSGVTSISAWTFSGCSSLKSIKLRDGVTEIRYGAFYNCSSLESISLPSGITAIEGETFYGCSSLESINIPDSVTTIGDYAFYGCSSLESVNIPNGVETIGDCTFYGCSSLKSITIPTSLAWIDSRAFAYCGSLTEIEVADGNESYKVQDGILYYCDADESLSVVRCLADMEDCVLSDEVDDIHSGAFWGCTNLKRIEVPADNEKYTSVDGVLFQKDMKTLICCPGGIEKKYEVPDTVEYIAAYAFAGCGGLTVIRIPESVQQIGDFAFYSCANLKNIEVSADNKCYISEDGVLFGVYEDSAMCLVRYPSGKEDTAYCVPYDVVEIAPGAFEGCDNLVNLNVSFGTNDWEEGKYIGERAFENCINLKGVTFRGEYYLYDGGDLFWGCKNVVVYAAENPGVFAWPLEDIAYWNGVPFVLGSLLMDDTNEDIVVEVPIGVASENTKLVVDDAVENGNVIISSALPDEYGSDTAKLYDIYLEQDGEKIQPTGAVTVSIAVPEGMDGEKCRVFYISEDGEAEDMNATYANGYITFSTTHFSYYVLAERAVTAGDVNGDGMITDADAVYLLMNTFFPDDYPVNQDSDFDGDGSVTDADAVYLLMNTFFPSDYPIN